MTSGSMGSPTDAALDAAFETAALFDRSDMGRLAADGKDILDLLNRLSTAAVARLSAGQGRETVLTTPKGRILERLFVHHLGEPGVLLVGGPGSAARVAAHLARFTFAEQTGLVDVTARTYLFALVGPRARQVLQAAGLDVPGACEVRDGRLADGPCHVLGQDGFSTDGFSITGPADAAPAVRQTLIEAVGSLDGAEGHATALDSYRILRGLPAAGHELNEEHNPLEAGLWSAVDFDKGCYVGQEVVARLRTYDKVSRSVVGLALPPGAAVPDVPVDLLLDGRSVGRLTSAAAPPGWPHAVALGYVKRRELRPDLELALGRGPDAVRGRVVELPFRRPAGA